MSAKKQTADSAAAPKKSIFRRVREWYRARATRKVQEKAAWRKDRQSPPPLEIQIDAIRVIVDEHKAPLEHGLRTEPIPGLHRGAGSDIYLERFQVFTAEEEKNPGRHLETPELLRRLQLIQGLRGDGCMRSLMVQSIKPPDSCRGKRFFAPADCLVDQKGIRWIREIEWDGKKLKSKLVPFDDWIWTARDWFVRQRI